MNKRLVLFTSIFLSVLILAVVGGVVKAVSARQLTQTISPELQSQIDAREAEYAAQIAEANKQIQTLSQVAATQTGQMEVQSISPENAALIALQTTSYEEALLQLPELVNYEGKAAYEVQVTDGVLYIDSLTGEVLFNGVPQRITAEQAAQIAGVYLGGMDPRYATVKMAGLNGSEVFQVTFNDYVVFVDPFGNVLQAQLYQYTNTSTNQSSSSNQSVFNGEHDDYDDDHDDEDDD
ncbi:MAG: hypothetical protein CVU39_14730 [Chloroflexi bacterium HGW-Chloroflexi-10]|nr:MAG: hypothetical protein CVU39_14730 [Chloroflexi bacterium HGW-Chloroflexi-10]